MAKRLATKGIKRAQSYTVEEIAAVAGVKHPTVRVWIKDMKLPAMTSRRPWLIIGEDYHNFVKGRTAARAIRLKDDELMCMHCKTGQRPLGMMVDYFPDAAKGGRLAGFCEVCEHPFNRLIGAKQLAHFSAVFELSHRLGP